MFFFSWEINIGTILFYKVLGTYILYIRRIFPKKNKIKNFKVKILAYAPTPVTIFSKIPVDEKALEEKRP